MTPMTVTVNGYPGNFRRHLSVLVEMDDTFPLDSATKKLLKPGTPFRFALTSAITAAERHLFIHGRPDNPVQLVEDWLNILRWELVTFWKADPDGSWYGRNDGGQLSFTWEHANRSGELLAEGIAIRLVERRMKVSRSRMRFFEDSGARPDYIIRVIGKQRKIIGIECRHRQNLAGLGTEDYKELKEKRDNPAITKLLAVYCGWGQPSVTGLTRTKILLADPPSGDVIASRAEVVVFLADHYLGVTSRIGLWDYMEWLTFVRSEAESGRIPKLDRNRTDLRKSIGFLPKRTYGTRRYVGRDFSSVELAKRQGRITKRQAQAMFRRNEFGTLTFHGLDERVLQMIETSDWASLERYFNADSDVDTDDLSSSILTPDGVVRDAHEVRDPQSSDAKAIEMPVMSGRWPT